MNGSDVVALIAVAAAVAVALASPVADAAAPAARVVPPLQEQSEGVTVDWGAGTLTTQAGAAADHRLPSADVARPGALRRARAAAIAKLKQALAGLPLGSDRRLPADAVERSLVRARTAAVEYQSNGGAVVSLVVHFTDWLETPTASSVPDGGPGAGGETPEAPAGSRPADVTIAVPAARLSAAPLVKVGKQEVALGAASYRIGVPPPAARAVPAKADRTGRLVVDGGPTAQKLAGSVAVIYVQKVTR